jgi:6-phosphogluconate dehydrogenase
MKLGLVGLGRMGAGIAERLRRAGHEVTGYDANPSVSEVPSLAALVEKLSPPRAVWVMVPAGAPTDGVIDELAGLLQRDDILIDGGNSYYKDSIRHGQQLSEKGIRFIDAGTSGGIWGLAEGFCIMTGGPRDAFEVIEPLLRDLAPEGGYAHLGPSGAGHFAKMVHNGIEYGMLQAYAEGFHLLHAAGFDYDLAAVSKLWNHGSVVRSWLLELAERAFEKDPGLSALRGYVDDSGEGRWTVLEAVERGVPAPVISEALFARFASRDDNSFAMRTIAALRNEFGGHPVHESDQT